MGIFGTKTQNTAGQVDMSRLPRHIAIIMDGNGRWAKMRGLPRTAGHKVGAETFRRIARHCKKLGIQYLTVYAFSTENWKRPKEEVDAIMALLDQYLREALPSMEKEHIRVKFFGDLSVLDPELRELAEKANALSDTIEGVQANLCLNYGGRDELVRAAKACAEAGVEWTEENFGKFLYSADVPDPELVIRPGGEQRISNFLLWQCAYSEFIFTPTLWPDFDEKTLEEAIIAYQQRDRRFGGVK
ncbi:MAG: di-trans,poly-cis-decaprenylcistransferase [Oscillospiraceae bacterium]|nr:di-trans,poly-cis-decaprenylcistransferase [Oscillospiraceae bacterium]